MTDENLNERDDADASPTPDRTPDAAPTGNADSADDLQSLLSRLSLIEERPLGERATAFSHVHDELQRTLEGGDSAPAQRG